jgi:segregation and condensation protein A
VATFKIRIPDFEGPLDLLLFFIKRDELDIYDIPIAHITKEFLAYVHVMQMLDLELAGEFIVMAATLMQIKARMLLPQTVVESGEEEIDPRAELTQRLLEYKRYKEASVSLQERELDQRQRFFRTYFKKDVRTQIVEDDENVLKDVTFFDLIKAFQKAIQNMPKKVVHEVRQIPWNIEEQGHVIMRFFQQRRTYNFLELAMQMEDKLQVVVTFLALLELMRAHRVSVEMHAEFNDFTITRHDSD